ncbi:hypothetical protein O9992_24605 [Vibrio lentus]|nr:hypothetical protein [Vibrio lentus]
MKITNLTRILFLKVASQLELEPSDCVVFEDIDYRPARSDIGRHGLLHG